MGEWLTANNGGGGINNRPDFVQGVLPNIGVHKHNGVVTFYNPKAFTTPPVNSQGLYFRPGAVGRNHFYGPGYDTAAVSIFKDVPITERFKGRAERRGIQPSQHAAVCRNRGCNISDNNGTINSTCFRSEREVELAFRVTF